jgi:hypothetical protein
MWRKGWRFSVFALLLALAMLWTPAFAAEVVTPAPGSGPEIPLGVTTEWTKLEAGGSSWHAFYFMHPHAYKKGETADASTVTVRMEFTPKEAAGKFEILTQKEVDLWARAEKYTAIGQSTRSCNCKAEDSLQRANWTGNPVGHTMNYVLLKNPAKVDLYYRLLIDENPYVAFPPPITAAVAAAPAPVAAVPAAAPAPATAAPAVAAAAPTVGNWFYLAPGKDAWFEFAYDANTGVKHDGTPEMMELKLFVEEKHPVDNVLFEVFTDAEYKQMIANGEDITGEDLAKGTAIGCGNPTAKAGEFLWKGNFTNSQVIHVLVHTGKMHADGLNLKLEASGKTVVPM